MPPHLGTKACFLTQSVPARLTLCRQPHFPCRVLSFSFPVSLHSPILPYIIPILPQSGLLLRNLICYPIYIGEATLLAMCTPYGNLKEVP